MNARLINSIILFVIALIGGTAATAQDELSNETCMMCHDALSAGIDYQIVIEDLVTSMTAEADNTTTHVVHGSMEFDCTMCHGDISEIPHAEDLAPVDCSMCHSDVTETWQGSVHGEAQQTDPQRESAVCTSCHGTHTILPASDPRSPVHHHNLAATCIQCHEDQALIERHELPGVEQIQSYVFSVHGHSTIEDLDSKAATCNNCHGWHDTQSHTSPDSKVSRENIAETCGQCHADVVEVYYESVHGDLAQQGNPDVAVCTDCHGEHRIRSPQNRESTVSPFQISETCARCHEDPQIIEKYSIPISSPSTYYRASVHGEALLSGENPEAAACHDCHGYHSILGGSDPESKVNKYNITDTCGSCHHHESVTEDYMEGIHYTALQAGVQESPVCTDCHGEHTILSHLDPESPVYPTRLAKEVCGRCHDSLVINRKYGLPAQKVETYFESYHGLASRLGDVTVANCASCHGVHKILPSTNPASMIHEDNLLQTCGSCHPGASPQFVQGLVHVSPQDKENFVLFIIRRIYIALIVVTIGGMLLHNFLIISRHLRDKFRRQRNIPHVQRFPTQAILQHLLLSIGFILLVITGFSLSYPESLFSRLVGQYLGLGEGTRGLVHRIAGVGLLVTIVWHLGTICLTRRGRRELRSLMFKFQDVKDVWQNVAYHVGLSKTKPRFDRYDYSEKMEYWAFLWGTVVMILTGLIMWFPALMSNWFGMTKIWVDAATVIHFYEAWLATLAIVIWHFFFVVFHPEEYPMAMSWLTGKLPVSEMKERHPKELERLIKAGEIRNPAGDDRDDGEPAEGFSK